jgi:hypothetical protein
MTNAKYLDQTFDFYGGGIRLQAHERTKIARSIVMKQMEIDVEKEAEKAQLLENEIDALQLLVGQAQASELKAKEEMWEAVIKHEELQERHKKDVSSLEDMIERLSNNFRSAITKKDEEA